jgi:ketosteroid isomerase-like protein
MIKLIGFVGLFAAALSAQESSPPEANVDAVRKMARELEGALTTADTKALEGLLTDDFIRTPPGGQDTNKRQYIELLRSGGLKYVAFRNVEEKFRPYSGAVLVNQVTDLTYRTATGPERGIRLKLLWVWVQQGGRWRAAAVQGNEVPAR